MRFCNEETIQHFRRSIILYVYVIIWQHIRYFVVTSYTNFTNRWYIDFTCWKESDLQREFCLNFKWNSSCSSAFIADTTTKYILQMSNFTPFPRKKISLPVSIPATRWLPRKYFLPNLHEFSSHLNANVYDYNCNITFMVNENFWNLLLTVTTKYHIDAS